MTPTAPRTPQGPTVREDTVTSYTSRPAPVFDRCEVEVSSFNPRMRVVSFHWKGVDRPCADSLSATIPNAARLVQAAKAGVLFTDARVMRDVHGRTYVEATRRVHAASVNKDLTALGF